MYILRFIDKVRRSQAWTFCFFSALAALLPIPKNQLDIAALFVLMCLLLLSAAAFLSYRKYKRIKTYANDTNNLNALYKTFLDAENNLIYLKDQNLKYVFVNKAFEYFFEIESRDIAGRDDSALQKKEFADRVMKDDREVLSSSTTVVKDYGYGGRVYRSIKFPVKLKRRHRVGAQIMDVTSEAASMKQQMICYQTLISIGDGVIVVDRDGRIEMMNKAAEKITGWPYAEAAKKPYRDVFNFFSEEKRGRTTLFPTCLRKTAPASLKSAVGFCQRTAAPVILNTTPHRLWTIWTKKSRWCWFSGMLPKKRNITTG